MLYPAIFQPYLGSGRLLLQNLLFLFVHATFPNRDPVLDHRVIHVLPGARDVAKHATWMGWGAKPDKLCSSLWGRAEGLGPIDLLPGYRQKLLEQDSHEISDLGIVAKSTKILRPFQIHFHLTL